MLDGPAEHEESPAAAADPPHHEEEIEPEPKAKPKRSRKAAAAVVEDAPEPEPVAEEAAPAEADGAAPAEAADEHPKKWYVVKVTSNREESIKAAIERRVKIEGLEEFFGQILIPVERITQVKKVVEKKKDTARR